MSPLRAQPDIDRRELLEAVATAMLGTAVADSQRALTRSEVGRHHSAMSQVRAFLQAVMTAVLAFYVQGGLSVHQRRSLIELAHSLTDSSYVHEALRTVRLVGLQTMRQHLRNEINLTRVEYLRLRSSAERVEFLVGTPDEETRPPRDDVLIRLLDTGSDLR